MKSSLDFFCQEIAKWSNQRLNASLFVIIQVGVLLNSYHYFLGQKLRRKDYENG